MKINKKKTFTFAKLIKTLIMQTRSRSKCFPALSMINTSKSVKIIKLQVNNMYFNIYDVFLSF